MAGGLQHSIERSEANSSRELMEPESDLVEVGEVTGSSSGFRTVCGVDVGIAACLLFSKIATVSART